jgi:hypothetical protein
VVLWFPHIFKNQQTRIEKVAQSGMDTGWILVHHFCENRFWFPEKKGRFFGSSGSVFERASTARISRWPALYSTGEDGPSGGEKMTGRWQCARCQESLDQWVRCLE